MRRTASLLLALVLALLLGAGAVRAQIPAETITLTDGGWSDSSVGEWDPATRTATLTRDVNGSIAVEADDITLDGAGHAVLDERPSSQSPTVGVAGTAGAARHGITIRNLTVTSSYIALSLSDVVNCAVSDSNATGAYGGIEVRGGYAVTVSGNAAASALSSAINLWGASRCLVSHNTVAGSRWGIYLTESSGCDVSDNTLSGIEYDGIIAMGDDNVIRRNNIELLGQGGGVSLSGSRCVVADNVISSGALGIQLGLWSSIATTAATVTGNNTTGCTCGAILNGVTASTLTLNTLCAADNATMTMWLTGSEGNTIVRNNMLGSRVAVWDSLPNTFWTPELGGNYWNVWWGPDDNRDGIVDMPIDLIGGIDERPWAHANGWLDWVPPTTTISLAGTEGAEGWYRSAVSVTLTAQDNPGGLGVSATEYRTAAGAAWQPYQAPFEVAGEGQTTVEYRSVDTIGNVEETQSRAIKIDGTPPAIAIATPQPDVSLPVGTALAFAAADSTSGLAGLTATLDGGAGPLPVSSGYVPGVGLYTLALLASDLAGNTITQTRTFAVYNPQGGSTSGGGWIDSPVGAYVAQPDVAGRAHLSFACRYAAGAQVPTGRLQFRLKAAGLDLDARSYAWLVVVGSRAQFEGTGAIGGAGSYGFIVTAQAGTPDLFRIKIWDTATSAVVYDTQPGAPDTAAPETPLGGGNIVVRP